MVVLQMKSGVVIVGNGSSILDAENGSVIDGYKSVCRFNDCKLKGFEKHTGTKTDVWFTVLKFNPRKLAELYPSEVVFHSWHTDTKSCPFYATYAGMPHVSKLDHLTVTEICAFMEDGTYQWWSTGTLAIWMMLKRFPSVTLTGFDWWDREKHHYADNEPRGKLHKPHLERQFIKKLEEQGKVNFL